MQEIYRGDIYYIDPFPAAGSEQKAGRPGLIVSNDKNNKYSPNVEIVFLTSQEKKPLPTHVPVMCRVPSTALCENILTVSKDRLSSFIRTCTEEELKSVDAALLSSLGITVKGEAKEIAPKENSHAEIERDFYKSLYEQLLNKLIGGKVK